MNPMYVYVIVAAAIVLVAALVLIITGSFRRVDPGWALVTNLSQRWRVSFAGGIVPPVVGFADVLDMRPKRIDVELQGRDGLRCRDHVRIDVTASFSIQVNKHPDDVLMVANHIGCRRASDEVQLHDLFAPKFAEGLQLVASKLTFDMLARNRNEFQDEVAQVIGQNLNGFRLQGIVIHSFRPVPREELDRRDVLDVMALSNLTDRSTP